MSRGNLPGAGEAVLLALVARVDGLEVNLDQQGRTTASLTRAVSALTEAVKAGPKPAPKPAGDDAVDGQPDWLAIDDPEVAEQLLVDLVDWHTQVAEALIGRTSPCWPWHPAAVVSALSLHRQYVEAYASESATGVSDLLTRWVPAHERRVRSLLDQCSLNEHMSGDRETWSVHLDQLPDLAHWWATDRSGTAPGMKAR